MAIISFSISIRKRGGIGLRRWMFGVRCSMFLSSKPENIEHPTSNIERRYEVSARDFW